MSSTDDMPPPQTHLLIRIHGMAEKGSAGTGCPPSRLHLHRHLAAAGIYMMTRTLTVGLPLADYALTELDIS